MKMCSAMEKFDINAIIKQYNIDTDNLAKVLFPTIKYPNLALTRVLKGETSIDTEQLRLLADFIGVPVSALFTTDGWKGCSYKGLLTFVKGEYEVRINYNGALALLYKNNVMLQQILICTSAITLNDFISILNDTISNLENGTN